MGVYTGLVTAVIMFVLFLVVIYAFASMRASRAIHVKLMDTLLASTFRHVWRYNDVFHQTD